VRVAVVVVVQDVNVRRLCAMRIRSCQ
jgi:hypothetical protein